MAASSVCPKVTIVIPNWNTQRWLDGCLNGLRGQSYRDFQVILVDNGSTDESVSYVRTHFLEVRVVTMSKNKGFAAAVNVGIKEADSEYVILLNVDTVPRPDWLANLVQTIEQSPPEVGSLASKMLSLTNPNLIDDAGDTFSWYGSARKRGLGEPAVNYDQPTEVFSACAGAALYRRAFLDEVGLFDEGFTSYLEDIDVGFRGRLLGYRCLYVPTAEVLHQGQGAGTPHAHYVYLITRNRLALLLKCVPTALWFKHAYPLLFGQFYFFLVYKKPGRSVAGYFSLLKSLPRIIRQRRAIQKCRKISNHALESMLSSNLGEPALRDIIKARLGWN